MNKSSLSYNQLENTIKIEIFDLEFEVEINENKFKELKQIRETNSDEKLVEEVINKILGNNAYNKIKNKYEKDLNKSIDRFVWAKVIYFVYIELAKNIKIQTAKYTHTNYRRNNNKFNRRRNYRR